MDLTPLDALKLAIQNAKVSTRPAEDETVKRFMPEGRLDEVLNDRTISSVLADSSFGIPAYKLGSTVNTVARECPKLLAILIELGLQSYLVHFLRNEWLDTQLPRTVKDLCLKALPPLKAIEFEALKWEYFPFRFRSAMYQKTIPPEVIVPFTYHEEVGKGGFSQVYKVIIHPTQQNLMLQEVKYLARKRICVSNNPSASELNEEAELLFLLGSVKHRNIVELLAAYRQGGFVNLLFPYFEQDLHKLLQEERRPFGFEEDAAIVQALHGLSSGLAHLHQFFPRSGESQIHQNPAMQGYHHDIKPRNILVGHQTFILSDFGCSNIKPPDQDTQTSWKDTTYEYGAPECRDMRTFIPGKVGRALDIWSLGCVFVEVITYMTSGAHGVTNFREQRRIRQIHGTVRCFHDGSRLSSQVDSHLEQLREKLLLHSRRVLLLVCTMFNHEPDERPSANVVENFMAVLALETHARVLTDQINTILSCQALKGSNVFHAQATIEKARLKAWMAVTGLECENTANLTVPDRLKGHALNIANMSKVIQSVIDRARSCMQSPDAESSQYGMLLNVIRSMNDELCLLTPRHLQKSIEETFLIFITTSTQQLLRGKEDLATWLGQNANDLSTLEQVQNFTVSRGVRELENLGRTSAMKRLSILFSEKKLESSGDVIKWSDIVPYRFDETESDPETYSYNGRRALVEWQDYGLPHDLDKLNEESDLLVYSLFGRMQALVTMLAYRPKPDAFRVLDCLGTVHDGDTQRFGLLYMFPVNDTRPVRLHKIFRHHGKQDKLPNPSEKLRLVKALVNALNGFHLSGWVHKNINSFNILFFRKESSSLATLDISEPYVVGFNYSRPNTPNAVSMGADTSRPYKEYHHPLYRQEGSYYRRYYDYYSLGLVLLEIGTWNPLSKIFDGPKSLTLSPGELTKEYIECCNTILTRLMGEKYAKATKACLEVDHWDNSTEKTSALEFQGRVVDEIRMCNF